MAKILKDGNEKIFIATCEHCCTDFEYKFEEVVKEKKDRVLPYVKTICPKCKQETFVNLATKEDVEVIKHMKAQREAFGPGFYCTI